MKTMKATGIVRRVDDLGRVVIPKEIRRSLRIREGEALEIFLEDGKVVFAKYNDSEGKEAFARDWLEQHKSKMTSMQARFTIENGITTCEAVMAGRRCSCVAKCTPSDTFSPSIGMAIAFCRVLGDAVPEELQ